MQTMCLSEPRSNASDGHASNISVMVYKESDIQKQ